MKPDKELHAAREPLVGVPCFTSAVFEVEKTREIEERISIAFSAGYVQYFRVG